MNKISEQQRENRIERLFMRASKLAISLPAKEFHMALSCDQVVRSENIFIFPLSDTLSH